MRGMDWEPNCRANDFAGAAIVAVSFTLRQLLTLLICAGNRAAVKSSHCIYGFVYLTCVLNPEDQQ
jgi:hypothetical protein